MLLKRRQNGESQKVNVIFAVGNADRRNLSTGFARFVGGDKTMRKCKYAKFLGNSSSCGAVYICKRKSDCPFGDYKFLVLFGIKDNKFYLCKRETGK